MTQDLVMSLGTQALKTTAMVSTPLLASALVVGLMVSIFQAITQINESTLTFIPKMIIVAVVLLLAGPWMMDILENYTINLFESIPDLVRH